MENKTSDFGELIRQARKTKRISARELGGRLSPPVTHGAIYAWESGKNKPNAEAIWQISEILEIDIRSFFPDSDSSVEYRFVALDEPDGLDELSDNYRKMNDKQRKAVLAVASAMVE